MDPQFLSLSILILLFSVIVHEVMHGVAALKFGDHTAEAAGRLTLNPIPHIDPIGTILLPLLLVITHAPILFGWAKPVPVNPRNFTDFRRGEFFVSSAGVLANFGLALLGAVILHVMGTENPIDMFSALLNYLVNINITLAILNLIPIPPLDGSKILISVLPYQLARPFQRLEQYGFLIFILILFIPFGNGSLVSFILGNGLLIFRQLLGL